MALLTQDTAGSLTVYIETTGGSPARDLTSSDVNASIKKANTSFFTDLTITDPSEATASIGAGANGTVTLAVPGTEGNTYTVEVTEPAGTSGLTISKSANVIVVELAVSAGVAVAASNTATLIAAAINALDSEVEATASGTGADSITAAEGPTTFTGGADGTFTELGGGFYEVDLSATDTDVLGTLYLRIQGTTINSSLESATIVEPNSASSSTALSVNTTLIYGYVYNSGGSPVSGASVSASILSEPTILHAGAEGLGVTTDSVSTSTDSDGYFTLSLLSGTTVQVFIPSLNYSRTFVVPANSSNLFDIP